MHRVSRNIDGGDKMKGVHLRTNRLKEPNSLTAGNVTFSWVCAGGGAQSALLIRILERGTIVYDSGVVKSVDTCFSPDYSTAGGREMGLDIDLV